MITSESGPIGIFDSGYGGLTILKEIRRTLPAYDYIYLGDNARAPTAPARSISFTASRSNPYAIFSAADAVW